MTANQLKLREIKENERHNRETERITETMNTATAEHYVRADQASLIQAYAAQSQAAAAHRNAAVNEINAVTNRYNAETNRIAAEAQISYNAGMLDVARQNAASQSLQAAAATTNAATTAAKQALDESKFEWQKSLDTEYLNIARYEANVKGLGVKQEAYEFSQTWPTEKENTESETKLNRAKKWQAWTGALKNFGQGVTELWETGGDIFRAIQFYAR